MAKVFVVNTPEELEALGRFAKSVNGLEGLVRVWRVEKRKGKMVPWDGAVYASFETIGRGRRALVYRQKTPDSKRIMAELKYAPALEWARDNLKIIDAAI